MITTLVVSTLVCAIIWVVRYVREGRAITRALRSFPGPLIANPTPPTRVELNGGFLIPPDRVASYVLNGRGEKVRTPGLGYLNEYRDYRMAEPRRTTISHFSSANPQPGDVWHDASDWPNRWPASSSGAWHYEPPEPPAPRAIPTRRDPITGAILNSAPTGCQHPNPEPVVLTTDEVVAGVCPDCLQPLPPSSVGSEWKP